MNTKKYFLIILALSMATTALPIQKEEKKQSLFHRLQKWCTIENIAIGSVVTLLLIAFFKSRKGTQPNPENPTNNPQNTSAQDQQALNNLVNSTRAAREHERLLATARQSAQRMLTEQRERERQQSQNNGGQNDESWTNGLSAAELANLRRQREELLRKQQAAQNQQPVQPTAQQPQGPLCLACQEPSTNFLECMHPMCAQCIIGLHNAGESRIGFWDYTAQFRCPECRYDISTAVLDEAKRNITEAN